MTTEVAEVFEEEVKEITKKRVPVRGINAVLFSDRTVEVKFSPAVPYSLGERTYTDCVAANDHNNLIMEGSTVRMLLAKITQEYAKFQKKQHLELNRIRDKESEEDQTNE